jgi:hypothetical protein
MREVYIGSGVRMESAVGLSMAPLLNLKMTKDKAADATYWTVYDCEIRHSLSPTEIFLITGKENYLLMAFHHASKRSPGLLLPRISKYNREDLKKYIESDVSQKNKPITDHVIVTHESLLDIVIEEVKQVGHNPITFK